MLILEAKLATEIRATLEVSMPSAGQTFNYTLQAQNPGVVEHKEKMKNKTKMQSADKVEIYMQSAEIWDLGKNVCGYSKVEIYIQSAEIWDLGKICVDIPSLKYTCKTQKSGILQGFWVDIPRLTLKYTCKTQKSGILQGFWVDIPRLKYTCKTQKSGIWVKEKVDIPRLKYACKAQKSGIWGKIWVDIPRLKYTCKAQKSGIWGKICVDIARLKYTSSRSFQVSDCPFSRFRTDSSYILLVCSCSLRILEMILFHLCSVVMYVNLTLHACTPATL